MLWVDKYRPNCLDEMEIHKELNSNLKNLIDNSPDFPHLLFYGPSGAGKRTRIFGLLRHIYGEELGRLTLENKEFKIPNTSKEIEITIIKSNYHLEFTPSDIGNNDRHIISLLIKEIAQFEPIKIKNVIPKEDNEIERNVFNFRIIVIHEVDNLTKTAQQALRRTMEKYSNSCRLILCSSSISKVIEPIRSRCLCIRVPAPSSEEILNCLQKTAEKENLTLPETFANKIIEECEGNLRRALIMFQASKLEKYPFLEDQKVKLPDWKMFIEEIAFDVIGEQSPAKILEIRSKLYELLGNCISPDLIFKELSKKLLSLSDHSLKSEIIYWCSVYDTRLKNGSKSIVHLESFIIKFMSLYKSFINEITADY